MEGSYHYRHQITFNQAIKDFLKDYPNGGMLSVFYDYSKGDVVGDVSSFGCNVKVLDEKHIRLSNIGIHDECGYFHNICWNRNESVIYDLEKNEFDNDIELTDKYDDGFDGPLSEMLLYVFCK